MNGGGNVVKNKIMIVFGTRPEAIKMVPIISELKKFPSRFETIVVVTAQHREMLDQVLDVFPIQTDYDLNIMKKNQSLSDITALSLVKLEKIMKETQPDMVLVHGDTTTSLSAALAAFYQKIPVGHVEAGLRTYDINLPFPEEANRQMIDDLTSIYFAPTDAAAKNLIEEKKEKQNIFVTGNTVIDAVLLTKKMESNQSVLNKMNKNYRWILLTMHRRENHGEPMKDVFKAVKELLTRNEDIGFVYPVHMSPKVKKIVESEFRLKDDRLLLVDPMEVHIFHKVLDKSYLVLTDSGGLQEEAPALNKPVLVLRDKTERPEGLEAGTIKLIGTEYESVVNNVERLLHNKELYNRMSSAENPYGDGKASVKIVEVISDYFKND